MGDPPSFATVQLRVTSDDAIRGALVSAVRLLETRLFRNALLANATASQRTLARISQASVNGDIDAHHGTLHSQQQLNLCPAVTVRSSQWRRAIDMRIMLVGQLMQIHAFDGIHALCFGSLPVGAVLPGQRHIHEQFADGLLPLIKEHMIEPRKRKRKREPLDGDAQQQPTEQPTEQPPEQPVHSTAACAHEAEALPEVDDASCSTEDTTAADAAQHSEEEAKDGMSPPSSPPLDKGRHSSPSLGC
mgnify:FL=1